VIYGCLSFNKCTLCKSLWIKASAKCPKCKCKCIPILISFPLVSSPGSPVCCPQQRHARLLQLSTARLVVVIVVVLLVHGAINAISDAGRKKQQTTSNNKQQQQQQQQHPGAFSKTKAFVQR